jgi:hypothetical protein
MRKFLTSKKIDADMEKNLYFMSLLRYDGVFDKNANQLGQNQKKLQAGKKEIA